MTVVAFFLDVSHLHVLYSRKFSSVNKYVKSDQQAVRQEFILVKRESSPSAALVDRPVVALLLIVYQIHEYF